MNPMLIVILWLLAAMTCLGAAPGPTAGAPSKSEAGEITILCTNGARYTLTNAVFAGNVRVYSPQMDLFCELFQVFFDTNRSSAAVLQTNRYSEPNLQSQGGRIISLIAETNVLLLHADNWASGDRAEWTATNDVVRLTGDVMLDTPQWYLIGTNVFFDRITGHFSTVGAVKMVGQPGTGLFSTNLMNLGLPGNLRAATNRPAGRGPRQRP